jgi:hypothetical protein
MALPVMSHMVPTAIVTVWAIVRVVAAIVVGAIVAVIWTVVPVAVVWIVPIPIIRIAPSDIDVDARTPPAAPAQSSPTPTAPSMMATPVTTTPAMATIRDGKSHGKPETLAAIRKALEKVGVQFTNGKRPGVRLAR